MIVDEGVVYFLHIIFNPFLFWCSFSFFFFTIESTAIFYNVLKKNVKHSKVNMSVIRCHCRFNVLWHVFWQQTIMSSSLMPRYLISSLKSLRYCWFVQGSPAFWCISMLGGEKSMHGYSSLCSYSMPLLSVSAVFHATFRVVINS